MRPWIRWLVFALWALTIFAAAPYANQIQAWIQQQFGAGALRYAVSALVLIAGAGLSAWLLRQGRVALGRLLGLLAVTAVALAVAWRLRVAAEPVHLAQYALLGLLAYWAHRAHLTDRGVHLAAAASTILVGTLDEIIQWLTPKRYFDFGDITLNAGAAVLIQLLLWQITRTSNLTAGIDPKSLRLAARLAAIEVLLLLLCAANTPHRIDAYADRLPGLAYLGKGLDTRMSEYGHRYRDSEIGLFRSRLDRRQLALADRELADEAARVLAEVAGKSWYHRLHRRYPPHKAPFVSEMGTHLFYRERLSQRAGEATDAAEERHLATVAYRENLILERYFPHALERTGKALPPAERTRLETLHRAEATFESEVSNWLITGLSEGQLRGVLVALLLGLVAVERRCARRMTDPVEAVSSVS